MLSKTYKKYRVRYNKCEALLFAIMICIVAFGVFYIGYEGFANRNQVDDIDDNPDDVPDTTPEQIAVTMDLYSETVGDLSGTLTIRSFNGAIKQVLTVDMYGIVIEDILLHDVGIYTVSYIGNINGINFGPVEYDVQNMGALLVDDVYFDVRLTVRT